MPEDDYGPETDYSHLDADTTIDDYTDYTLADIMSAADELIALKDQISTLNEKLQLYRKRQDVLEQEVVPQALLWNGVTELKLKDGRKIKTKEEASSSIEDSDELEILLTQKGAEHLMSFTLEFKGLNKAQRQKVLDAIDKLKYERKTKFGANHQSLSAWVRDALGLRVTDEERQEGIQNGLYLTEQAVSKAVKIFRRYRTTITKR